MKPTALALALFVCVLATLAPARAAVNFEDLECHGWPELQSLTIAGTIQTHNMTGTFSEILNPQTGEFVRKTVTDGLTEIDGADDNSAWTQDFSGTVHRYDSDHAKALAGTNTWLNHRGWCDTYPTGKIDYGKTTHDGRTYETIRATPMNSVTAEVWFDTGTALPDRTIVRENEDTLVTHFADWREAAGTIVPFTRRLEDVEDQDVTTLVTTSVTAGGAPAPGTFAPPATTNTSSMLHGARSTTVPIRIENRKILVDVMLDGRVPFPFVFDTGGHFILTTGTAKTLGLHVVGTDPAAPARERDGFARVGDFRIGDAVVRGDVAHVVPYSFARLERGANPPKAGWLGLELLERFAVVIDPAKLTMTLTPLSQAPASYVGTRVNFVLDEDAPLVPCHIDGHFGQCMIDTGDASPTIVEGHWSKANGLSSRFSNGLDAGDGVRVARASVDVGAIHLPHEIVMSFPQEDSGSESTTVEAGIISETFHERYITSIDYAQRAMWFAAVPGAPAPIFNRTGLVLSKQSDGTFMVAYVYPGSPAAAAGLKEKDRIVSIDGKPAEGWTTLAVAASNVAAVGTLRTYVVKTPEAPGVRTVQLRLVDMLP